jgi:ferritin
MKYLSAIVLFCVLTIVYAAEQEKQCDRSVGDLCSMQGVGEIVNCNSITKEHKWDAAQTILRSYAKENLKRSYELLGLAINHGTFSRNRPGFEKLFRQLSDEAFDNSIKIIKYITSRGGSMSFDGMEIGFQAKQFFKNEFHSLSVAQSIEKKLLETAHGFVHTTHDPNTLHFIEEEFIEPKTDVLRKLTGYVHDMDKLLVTSDSSLNIYLFDEYLQK